MTAADDRADQIRARLAAATPGPWTHDRAFDADFVCAGHNGEMVSQSWVLRLDSRPGRRQDAKDADLIANAPADLAFLLAERTELLRRVEQAERESLSRVAGSVAREWRARAVVAERALEQAERAGAVKALTKRDVSHYCQHENRRAHMCVCDIYDDHDSDQCSRESKEKK